MKDSTSDPNHNEVERGIAFADFHAGYVATYIQLADAKAGATFAATAGVLAYLLTWDRFVDAITTPALSPSFFVAVSALVLLVASSALSFGVIAPRLPRSGGDLVFWKSVAIEKSGQEYAGKVLRLSPKEMARQLLVHCFDLSGVCARKYENLRLAMLVGAVAMGAALLARLVLPPDAKLTEKLTTTEKTAQPLSKIPVKSLK